MNIFIFQSVPARYDLRVVIEPGVHDTWYVTRYRTDMNPGDIVFFWMAGDEKARGLYGWGHIDGKPYLQPGWTSHGVDVVYDVKFKQPISALAVRSEATLSDMLIFRAPSATNFLLPPDQAYQLLQFISEQGEEAPALSSLANV